MLYTCDVLEALVRVEYIMREINRGWFLRVSHFNGARLFFVLLYLHIGRGLIIGRFRLWKVWTSGVILLLIVIGEALIGYVLPWGQISVWGACVITRLFRVLPYVGEILVTWVWGGLVVNRSTLGCLFMLHYLLPLIIIGGVIIHLLSLHERGSTNRTGGNDRELKLKFFPFFIIKDVVNLSCWGLFLTLICWLPLLLGDCENFKEANLIRRPTHIQPEWYFLLLYAILRAVPNKLGGVILLAFSLCCIWCLCLLPNSYQSNWIRINCVILRILFSIVVILTLLGTSPVEIPLVFIRQVVTLVYFLFFLCLRTLWLIRW